MLLMQESMTFRELRESLKIPRRIFSESFGVPVSTVIRWERFQAVPDEETQRAIADIFGVAPEQIRWVPKANVREGTVMTTDRGRSFIKMPDGKVLW